MRKADPGQLGKHIHQYIFTTWVSLESESTRVNPDHYNQTFAVIHLHLCNNKTFHYWPYRQV